MTKQEILEKVNEVLTNFLEQEIGNKITQYNMQGLANIIGAAIESIPNVDTSVKPAKDRK